MNKLRKQREPDLEQPDDAVIGWALRWSLAVLLVLAAAGGGVAWWLTRPAPPLPVKQTPLSRLEVRERGKVELPEIPLTDITSEAGIQFVHENGAYGDKLLPETMGGGCAFLDYNNNGHQDILLVNSSRWPWDPRGPADPPATLKLYENDGTGRFQDVTADAGLDVSLYGMGVAVGDYDNDGHVDIFITAVGRNRLFRNVGGRFEEVTRAAGVGGDEEAWSTSTAWLDYNNNGRLDLFVCNYVRWSQQTDLGQDFRLVGVGRAYGPPTAFQGTFCYLYRNNGDGTFTDVSGDAGIQVRNPATGVPMGKSLGVVPVDLDGDGWLDLVVANDTVQNFVFHNQRDGTFREIGALTGIAFDSAGNARGAMGIDAARFRNDSTLGVAIGNFSNEMTALYVSQDQSLQFVDAAIATGLGPLTRLELTFGVFFFDADLDGRLDLLAANGHLEEEISKVQRTQHYRQPPQLFWNCGPGQSTEFRPLPADKCGQDFLHPLVGRGAAFADIDGDGDLDVLLTSAGGPPRLLRNDQNLGHNWVRLKLVGTRSNRDAIGAWVAVHAGGQVQWRQVMPSRSYLSQVELPVTVGIGQADEIEKVVVHWPDGTRQELPNPPLNQLHTIEQNAEERRAEPGVSLRTRRPHVPTWRTRLACASLHP